MELTKDTVYKHPTVKQCDYSVDLTNCATKDELEKVKGMIDVSARIVHTGSFWVDSLNYTAKYAAKIACATEYDYVEVSTGPFIISDVVYPTTLTIIKKGDTANVPGVYNDSSYSRTIIWPFEITANSDGISSSIEMTSRLLYMSATFYKYDSQ